MNIDCNLIEILTLVILFFTLIAILWYSWETRELRKWQRRQAQLSVIHMEMNRVISEHANGLERSSGFHLGRWEMIQRKIIQGEDVDMKDVFDTNKNF